VLTETVFRLVSQTEEPLQEAMHLVHMLSLVDPKDSDDLQSIAFVGTKVEAHLREVKQALLGLFAACRARP
jgi:hypothetical protein